MTSKATILEELKYLTSTLSTQVRTTALGALAFSWGLLIGDSPVARSLAGQLKWHLVGIGAMAILTMFLDFGQYFAGYINASSLYQTLEAAKANEGEYDYSSLSYRLRVYLFYGKIVSLTLTVIWLLSVLGFWLIRSYG